MRIFLILIATIFTFSGGDENGSLSVNDVKNGPISFRANIDSITTIFGIPKTIERTVGFCGKGPIFINGKIAPGDSVYCDSLIIYTYDSLTICFDINGNMEYYFFTTSRFATVRGVRTGDPQEKIIELYGQPTWGDSLRSYSDWLPSEDDEIRYQVSKGVQGIAFYLHKGKVRRIFIGRGSAC